MLLMFYALPPLTEFVEPIYDRPFVDDEDDEIIALLAHFQYYE